MNLENLDTVVDFIIERNLIEKGDRVGVAVSGGEDSMALLHFLESLKTPLGISVIAINVNHNIRPGSRKDSQFVAKYCKSHGIEYVGYNVDVPTFAKAQKMGIEQAARVKRYEAFRAAVKRFKLNKIALAHHLGDQAETILLHIFRGAGIAGASGMEIIREFDGTHAHIIRPLLETAKSEIVAYNYRNQVPHVEDETNNDSNYARNFLRNEVIPMLQREWRNVEKNIVDFGRNCQSDNSYLSSIVNTAALIAEENHVRIPLNFFVYPYSVISRIIMAAFESIGIKENIEKKHIDQIITLAGSGENGSRTDLPNNLFAIKEYEYMAIVRRVAPSVSKIYSFKTGRMVFHEYGTIIVTKTISHKDAVARGLMVIDVDKLPRASKWRTRKEGDVITKLGSSGQKSLNAYLIDKKVPSRLRDNLPVLANGSEIYAVAGLDISDKVKTDRETMEAYVVEFVKD